MKYRLVRFTAVPVDVYLVPVSAQPEDCRLLVPRLTEQTMREIAGRGGLRVRHFPVTDETREAAGREIGRLWAQSVAGYRSRRTTLFAAGLGLAALGLLSWFVPDPLLLVDEIAFVVAGALMAVTGGRALFGPDFRALRSASSRLTWSADALLSRVHRALQAREKAAGDVEAESAWLVEYADLGRPLASGEVAPATVRRTLAALSQFIPFERLLALESRSGSRARAGLRKLRHRLEERHGLGEPALTVLCAFYRSAREHLAVYP